MSGTRGRIDRQKTWLRILTGVVIACLTLANLLAAARLVDDILSNNKLFATNAGALLATGGVIWLTNVIAFGLWYWDLDRGGAAARAPHPDANPAFVFPEMLNSQFVVAGWVPKFADYLSLGFWTATAFSPTASFPPDDSDRASDDNHKVSGHAELAMATLVMAHTMILITRPGAALKHSAQSCRFCLGTRKQTAQWQSLPSPAGAGHRCVQHGTGM